MEGRRGPPQGAPSRVERKETPRSARAPAAAPSPVPAVPRAPWPPRAPTGPSISGAARPAWPAVSGPPPRWVLGAAVGLGRGGAGLRGPSRGSWAPLGPGCLPRTHLLLARLRLSARRQWTPRVCGGAAGGSGRQGRGRTTGAGGGGSLTVTDCC